MDTMDLLRTCCWVAGSVSLSSMAWATQAQEIALKVPGPDRVLASLRAGHPRLLADARRFAEIRSRSKSDPQMRAWMQKVREASKKLLAEPPSEYVIPDGLRLLATSRRVLDRVTNLGFMYQMDGARAWAERAWKELEASAKFKDWNPRHFLDTGEMTCAFAIGYDWLYDAWTPDQRQTIRQAILDKGFGPGLNTYRTKAWWTVDPYNWNQVCNGGLAMGALAIGDEAPEPSGEILSSALKSLPRAIAMYGPDGAWGEGPGYWAYATMYTVTILAGLQSALGTDYGLSDIPGLSLAGLFPIHASSPTGTSFSYADAHAGVVRSPEMWWLADRYQNSAYAAYIAARTSGGVRDLLWYRPDLARKPVNLPLSYRFRGCEVATMRTAWDDPQALYVAFKAGDNKVNHSHLDLGSFVLDALGERWAEDIGSDDYNMPAYFGNQRWTYYRLRAEGHNTVVLNPDRGPDQDPKAVAPIVKFDASPKRSVVVADLTKASGGRVQSHLRGVALVGKRTVVVQDEIECKQPSDAWWFLHTGAAIEIAADGKSATLRKGDAKLLARIVAPSSARFEAMDATPLPTSPNPPMQNKNTGIRKLSIHLAGQSSISLLVELAPLRSGERLPKTPTLVPLKAW